MKTQEGIQVSVSYSQKWKKKEAETVYIEGRLYRGIKNLKDGTLLDICKTMWHTEYRLQDGEVLLYERYSGVPELAEENEKVWVSMLNVFEEKGLLYDVNDLLEQSYAHYRRDISRFQGWSVVQELAVLAENEHILCILLDASIPTGELSVGIREGYFFHKATGELLDMYDLFTCTRQELEAFLIMQLPKEAQTETAHLMLDERGITLFQNGNMEFACDVSGYGDQIIICVEGEMLKPMLQSWAVID